MSENMIISSEFRDLIRNLIREGESDEWISYLWAMATHPEEHHWEAEARRRALERHADSMAIMADVKRTMTFGLYQAPKERKRGQSED